MKPSKEQDLLLKEYLSKALRYRETYEEVYDHIISSLAQQGTTTDFEATVNRIIREDFGGQNQLKELENIAKKSAFKDSLSKYLQYYFSYFKWPLIPFTLCITLLIYFTLAQTELNSWIWQAFRIIAMIPFYFLVVSYFKIGYLSGKSKASVKDNILYRIAMLPSWACLLFSTIYIVPILNGHHHFWERGNQMLITAVYVVTIIYFLSIIKLYRNEFKMSIKA